MVQFTLEQLKAIMPNANKMRIEEALPYLNKTLVDFEINTLLRAACFIAQLAHESMSLRYYAEIASGKAYEGRKDLGNTQPGDGVRFKGRGPIQNTGRSGYQALKDYTGHDFIAHPEDLEKPEWGFLAAGWFWHIKCRPSLNTYADTRRFRQITKRINGGLNGWEDRKEYYYRACKVLGLSDNECTILD